MKTNLNDLFAALPEEYSRPDVLDSDDARERLQTIFADLSLKPVPTGSLQSRSECDSSQRVRAAGAVGRTYRNRAKRHHTVGAVTFGDFFFTAWS